MRPARPSLIIPPARPSSRRPVAPMLGSPEAKAADEASAELVSGKFPIVRRCELCGAVSRANPLCAGCAAE